MTPMACGALTGLVIAALNFIFFWRRETGRSKDDETFAMHETGHFELCTSCRRMDDQLILAGEHFLCQRCWRQLLAGHCCKFCDLPPEIARKILNDAVLSRLDSERAWESLRYRTYNNVLTDGIAVFFPTVWVMFAAWITYKGITGPQPLTMTGAILISFYLGALAVHIFYQRRIVRQ